MKSGVITCKTIRCSDSTHVTDTLTSGALSSTSLTIGSSLSCTNGVFSIGSNAMTTGSMTASTISCSGLATGKVYSACFRLAADWAVSDAGSGVDVDFTSNGGPTSVWNSNWTSVTGATFSIPVTGYYLCVYQVAWASNATGNRRAYWSVNGDTTYGAAGSCFPQSTNTNCVQSASAELYMAAGDTIALHVYQNSGGSLNVLSNASWSMPTYVQFYRIYPRT